MTGGAAAELLRDNTMASVKFIARRHESQADARDSYHDNKRRIGSSQSRPRDVRTFSLLYLCDLARSTSNPTGISREYQNIGIAIIKNYGWPKASELMIASVIFVTKIKTTTKNIGRRFQRSRTRIIVTQKSKTK